MARKMIESRFERFEYTDTRGIHHSGSSSCTKSNIGIFVKVISDKGGTDEVLIIGDSVDLTRNWIITEIDRKQRK